MGSPRLFLVPETSPGSASPELQASDPKHAPLTCRLLSAFWPTASTEKAPRTCLRRCDVCCHLTMLRAAGFQDPSAPSRLPRPPPNQGPITAGGRRLSDGLTLQHRVCSQPLAPQPPGQRGPCSCIAPAPLQPPHVTGRSSHGPAGVCLPVCFPDKTTRSLEERRAC